MSRHFGSIAVAIAFAGISTSSFAGGGLRAATITVVNADGAGEGFNDSTSVAAVAGNPATMLGQQRLNAFAAAAAYWANRLASPVQIVIRAQMNSLTCSITSGVLGAAGPAGFARDFNNAPLSNTWYNYALANAIDGTDLDTSSEDIAAQFNSSVGAAGCLPSLSWSYVIGAPAPAGSLPFFETVKHEIGHGLGFLTAVNPSTGVKLDGRDDVFMTFLEDHSTGKTWPQMTNGERVASAKDAGDLHWTGQLVQSSGAALLSGRHPGGHVQMFAPTTLQIGSSVSHWDTALSPDEIMEPFATANPQDIVTTALLRDIGWKTQQSTLCVRDADTACLLGGRFEVNVAFQSGAGNGSAQVMTFGGQRAESDESAFFTFFSATNFEMGVKVLNACVPILGNHFWVFISGLTDQGWTVTVRDSQTGATQSYNNAVGHLSSTFAHTVAFSCP